MSQPRSSLSARWRNGSRSSVALVVAALLLLVDARHASAEEPAAQAASERGPRLACPSTIPLPAPKVDAEYQIAITDAVLDHDAGRFAEARAQFLRAHELSPSARTLRGLGMVEFELRNYPESVRHLEAALACPVRALQGELREEAQVLLRRARAYVGEVHVHVTPDTAAIDVDGATVARGPDATILLVVGKHELGLSAPEHRSESRTLSITGGDLRNLRVTLEKLAAGAEPPRAAPAAPSADAALPQAPAHSERLVRKWWLWTLVGVAVAAAGAGLTVALRSGEREQRDFQQKCSQRCQAQHGRAGELTEVIGDSLR